MMPKVARGKIKTRGMREQVSREQRKRTYIFFACIALALAYLSYNLMFGEMGVIKYIEIKHNKTRLDGEITRIDKENKALNIQVNSLKKDPYYIEKYAREEYGLAKPGEFIFQFKNDDK
jgi:cell division protein FtsB